MKYQCLNCWWNPICKRTIKACKMVQGIDIRWDESPNNKVSLKERRDKTLTQSTKKGDDKIG